MNRLTKARGLALVSVALLLGGCVYEDGYTRPAYSSGVVVTPSYGYDNGYYDPWWGGSSYIYYDRGWGHGGWHDGHRGGRGGSPGHHGGGNHGHPGHH